MTGFRYPFRAVGFILDHPSLLKYIVWPFLINGLVFGSGFFFFLTKLDNLLSFIPKDDSWFWDLLFYVLVVLLTMIFLIVAFYAFTIIGNIVASPFNSALSEKTETLMNCAPVSSSSRVIPFFRDVLHSIGTEIKRLLFFLLWLIPLLLINVIPIVGPYLYFAWMLFFTCYAVTFSFMDYSLDRRYRSFLRKNQIILSNKAMMLGFGSVGMIMGLIPIVNFFLIPVMVVAGTLMTIDVLKKIPT